MTSNLNPLQMKHTKLLPLLLLAGICANAQTDKPIFKERIRPEDRWQRAFVGVNATPSFGFGAFQLYVSPTLGYKVSDNFNVAAGPLYMFFTQRNSAGTRNNYSIWGARLWAQHRIYRTFYVHGEYELMGAIRGINPATGSLERQTIGNPLAGFALVSGGDRSFQSIALLYNLNYIDGLTPYGTVGGIPILIRAGWCFNLGGRR